MTQLPPIPPAPPAPAPLPRTSGTAIASLILGTLAVAGAWCCCLGLPCSVMAVIFGHFALSKIRRSQGGLDGRGLAIAGLLTGYLGIILHFLAILFWLAMAICSHQHHQAVQWQMHRQWGS